MGKKAFRYLIPVLALSLIGLLFFGKTLEIAEGDKRSTAGVSFKKQLKKEEEKLSSSVTSVQDEKESFDNDSESQSSEEKKIDCAEKLMGEQKDQLSKIQALAKRIEQEGDSRFPFWLMHPSFYQPQENSQSAMDLFYRGLAYGKFLVGVKGPMKDVKKDSQKAIEYFEEASKLDPDNAAPVVYIATLLFEMGNMEMAQSMMMEANSKGKFDTYIQWVAQEMMRSSYTGMQWVQVALVVSILPIGDYGQMEKVLLKYGSQNLIENMMTYEGGDHPKDIYQVDTLKYAVGHKIARKKWPEWSQNYITIRQLLRKVTGDQSEDLKKWREFEANGCDVSSGLDDWFFGFKAAIFDPYYGDDSEKN